MAEERANAARGRIVLPGGAGMLGRILGRRFRRGFEVVVLTRKLRGKNDGGGVREAYWDGRTLGDAEAGWRRELEGAEAVINLAGRSVNCRYTRRNRGLIYDSRIESTRVLGEAIGRCVRPPRVWLNSSTATIYKHSPDVPMDERNGIIGATAEAHDAFSIKVAMDWEKVFAEAITPGTRKVALRTAMVLAANEAGVFRILRMLARVGLGGKVGSGRQYVSWIHEADFCGAVEFILGRADMSGAVNVVAPGAVRNAAMMRTFRRSCGRWFGLPTPRAMLAIGAFFVRTEPELLLKSRYVVPGRLMEAGFGFAFPGIEGAVRELARRAEGGCKE